MTLNTHTPDVERWLSTHGWFPGRDIGERAHEIVSLRVHGAREQGSPLTPLEAATRIIRLYGGLELPYPGAEPEMTLIMNPATGSRGDVRQISELAEGLGLQLFPVAFETYENGIWLVGETGRFFYLHPTGGYFLG
ncbi:SUKH-3 domain-containing protein [Streptomyces morookaense]|uniref:SUKH-3 domain-containing protein n=1 Tax=Streptomyces morookaense TaxID=1970 RepID=UPI0033CD0892